MTDSHTLGWTSDPYIMTSRHSSMSASNSPNSKSFSAPISGKENTVQVACVSCRNKHLKCSGRSPCSRCEGARSKCVYVPSRRGYKGPRRNQPHSPNTSKVTSPPPPPFYSLHPPAPVNVSDNLAAFSSGLAESCTALPSVCGQPLNTTTSLFYSPYQSIHPTNLNYNNFNIYHPEDHAAIVSRTQQPLTVLDTFSAAGQYLESFFHYFHASHPFVLPKHYLLSLSEDLSLGPLLAAVYYVGSLFIDVGNTRQDLLQEAYRLIYEPGRIPDGFIIQAMMLLIIALDGNDENAKALEILSDAKNLAKKIGLNTKAFATANGRALPVLEESWRRTCWDLYMIDIMIIGFHPMANISLRDFDLDVELPCEELQYLSGNIPRPSTLQDLENKELSGDNREFSSFAYRILCGCYLKQYLQASPIQGPDDKTLARLDVLLTNWRLHLPPSKKAALMDNGTYDEMMFQAHMMNNATCILLHQSFSQLSGVQTQYIANCVPFQTLNTHTKHTIDAACAISELVTHRTPFPSHTHFFKAAVAMSSIVHLYKWGAFFGPHDDDDLRQRIRLNIGALGQLSEVWTAADRVRSQIQVVACQIYEIKKQQRENPQYWRGFSQEDVRSSIAADEEMGWDI